MKELENQTQSDSEFSKNTVPMSQRRSMLSIATVWAGVVFVMTSIMAGGTLATGLTFHEVIFAAFIGNIVLLLIAVLVSIMAFRTGLTFPLLTHYTFGLYGSKIATVISPIVNMGWYVIQAATYGHFIALVFGFGNTAELICLAISAVVMGLFALFGMKALTILGYISIPAIIFLGTATIVKCLIVGGGISALFTYVPEQPITLFAGATAVIGAWVSGVSTVNADIMRYAKSAKDAVMATIIGIILANLLMIFCGAIATITMNESDISAVLIGLGLVIPGTILMTTNIWTTNASTLYSITLGLCNSFPISRKTLTSICIAIAAAACLFRPYQINVVYSILNLLGTVIPPLAGIEISDFYILKRGKYTKFEDAKFCKWNPFVWIAWVIAAAAAFLIPVGLPAINGMLIGGLLYIALMKSTNYQVVCGKSSENI